MGVIHFKCVFVSDNLSRFNNRHNDFFLTGTFNIGNFEKILEEFAH